MKSLKNILSNVFIILGTMIGGGLATGKELAIFFCSFGKHYYIACVLCIIFFTLILIIINQSDFTKANSFINIAFFIFRLIICSTMLSALKSVTLLMQNSLFYYIILLIICFALMFCNFNQLSKIFNIIVPFIFIVLLIVSVIAINTSNTVITATEIDISKMILNSSIYSAFNLFLMVYIVKVSFNRSTKIENIVSIIILTCLISVLLIILCNAILKTNSQNFEIPFYNIIKNINPNATLIIISIIIMAIITTFLGINCELQNTLNTILKPKLKSTTNILLFSLYLLISNIGFDALINYAYKALGIIALIYFIYKFFNKICINHKYKHNIIKQG